ncbi:hypothetical protein [Ottowia sp. oral taxon 894]|uniref:hypothetical protein n=1 Tax=Ottowia sp. oral taxon 894 TaxID=1658672 RepID=UPI0012E1A07B|nr:hypothetical protein [Ottowia sp. oral taxon 894]
MVTFTRAGLENRSDYSDKQERLSSDFYAFLRNDRFALCFLPGLFSASVKAVANACAKFWPRKTRKAGAKKGAGRKWMDCDELILLLYP